MIPAESVDTIRMSWQPEPADYAETFRARNRKRRVGWLPAGMVVLGAGFAVLAFIGGEPAIAVVGIVIAVFFALIGTLGTNFLYQRNPALHQPVQVVVDPGAGVAGTIPVVSLAGGPMKVNAGTWQFPWPQLHTVLETKRVFVVHVGDQDDKTFFVLAKRAVADPAALRRVLDRAVRP